MKYLKSFELYTGHIIDYEEGDTVVCVSEPQKPSSYLPKPTMYDTFKHASMGIEIGKKYKVLKIYQLPEDKYLNNPYMRVDVENIETKEISRGWRSDYFKSELEFNADKYNM